MTDLLPIGIGLDVCTHIPAEDDTGDQQQRRDGIAQDAVVGEGHSVTGAVGGRARSPRSCTSCMPSKRQSESSHAGPIVPHHTKTRVGYIIGPLKRSKAFFLVDVRPGMVINGSPDGVADNLACPTHERVDV